MALKSISVPENQTVFKMNQNSQIFCTSLALLMVATISCSTKKNMNHTTLDTNKVIESGIEHIFKKQIFHKEYYTHSIKIFKSKYTPNSLKFKINGRDSELIPKPPKGLNYFINDIFNPIPFIGVRSIKTNPDNSISVDLLLPSTGDWIIVKMQPKNTLTWTLVDLWDAKVKTGI